MTARTSPAFAVVAAGIVAAACVFPFASPRAGRPGDSPLWHLALPAGLDSMTLLLGGAGLVWLVLASRSARRSALDAVVAAILLTLAALHLLALARGEPVIAYELADARRLAMLAGGYLLVSRLGPRVSERWWWLVPALLLATAAWLVLRHGVLGETDFATLSGRSALIITEDTLLVGIPLVLLWGRVVDGLAGRWATIGTVALIGIVLVVELASLRRGALLFIGLMLAARTLWAPRRALAAVAAAAVVGAVLTLAGPLRPLAADAGYAVRSSLLLTVDASSEQRRAELEDFANNVTAPEDLLLGRGFGAVWNAETPAPTDVASFGAGETTFVRLGWHVYGLDWAYRIGLVGLALVLAALLAGAATIRDRLLVERDAGVRSTVASLALAVPVLGLFVLTNPRVAFLAGVCAGMVSALLDRAPVDEDGTGGGGVPAAQGAAA